MFNVGYVLRDVCVDKSMENTGENQIDYLEEVVGSLSRHLQHPFLKYWELNCNVPIISKKIQSSFSPVRQVLSHFHINTEFVFTRHPEQT